MPRSRRGAEMRKVRRRSFVVIVGLLVTLETGCAPGQQSAAPATPALGTVGGAAAGGALGSLVGSGRGRVAAIVGGALLGGVAGNQLVDRPVEAQQRQETEAARDRDMQRRLDYERQSMIQRNQVQQELEEQRLFEQWKREQGY